MCKAKKGLDFTHEVYVEFSHNSVVHLTIGFKKSSWNVPQKKLWELKRHISECFGSELKF